jgi:N-acetylglucosamine kinase-like BadF-type ATPase
MRYFLGVDIGNTKSHALIADESGRAVGFGRGGNGNYESVGWDGLRNTLHTITEQALASADISKMQLSGSGFGVAGYDWPAQYEPTCQIIASLELSAPFELVNDATVGLLAGATAGWGVVVGAGTSNNCRGRDRRGHGGRVVGCGPWAGEYGGAGELVAKAVQAVAMAWTRRAPPTRLTEAFIKLTGASDAMSLLEGLALKQYRLSAADAPIIFQVAAEGDMVAQNIIGWAGQELGSLAVGVIRQLGFENLEFEVILTGSVYNSNSSILLGSLRHTIHAVAPKARLIRLNAPPVVGSVLLGMEQVGIDYISVRQTLIQTTNAMLISENSRPI